MFKTKTKVWIEQDGTFLVSRGKAELLQRIDETGSLSEAAKQMGMSYRHAWGLIRKLEEAMGCKAVLSIRGGNKRGQSKLTAEGRKLLEFYVQRNNGIQSYSNDGPWAKPMVVAICKHQKKVLMTKKGKVWSVPRSVVKEGDDPQGTYGKLVKDLGITAAKVQFKTLVDGDTLFLVKEVQLKEAPSFKKKGAKHGFFDKGNLPDCSEQDKFILEKLG